MLSQGDGRGTFYFAVHWASSSERKTNLFATESTPSLHQSKMDLTEKQPARLETISLLRIPDSLFFERPMMQESIFSHAFQIFYGFKTWITKVLKHAIVKCHNIFKLRQTFSMSHVGRSRQDFTEGDAAVHTLQEMFGAERECLPLDIIQAQVTGSEELTRLGNGGDIHFHCSFIGS